MASDPTFKTHSEDELAEHATEPAKTRENPGREVPGVSETDDKPYYPTTTDKCTERTPRTGLRKVDEHASRHDVRAACHCVPEGHE